MRRGIGRGLMAFVGVLLLLPSLSCAQTDELERLNEQVERLRAKKDYRNATKSAEHAVAILEQRFDSQHPALIPALDRVAELYKAQSNLTKAATAYARSLSIAEKTLDPGDPTLATHLDNLALAYLGRGRYAEAEPLLKRSLDIREQARGAESTAVGKALNNLGILYKKQKRYADAELAYNRALGIIERSLGPEHPSTATVLENLAGLAYVQEQWSKAVKLYRRSLQARLLRARRSVEATDRRQRRGSGPNRLAIALLIKSAHRSLAGGRDAALQSEMFIAAQWATASAAGTALSQTAARLAAGNATIDNLVREQRELAAEWNLKNKLLTEALAEPPARRKPESETLWRARLAAIDARVAEIDKALKEGFPDYSAVANPAPVSVADIQAELRPNEVLVYFVETPAWEQTPEEAVGWAVTKKESRWFRVDLADDGLEDRVAALRCGLDSSYWIDPDTFLDGTNIKRAFEQTGLRERCKELTGANVRDTAPLPFDLAKAHALYQALFGQINDMIKGKQLVVVPTGSLARLPFQVLVTEKPAVPIPKDAAGYRGAAWLIKRHAIAVLPSVGSLRTLRRSTPRSAARKPYIGFGNPLLLGADGTDMRSFAIESCSKRIAVPEPPRAPARDRPNLGRPRPTHDTSPGGLEVLRRQPPLPETADELCAVARALNADETDVYLGAAATEKAVKSLSASGALANARVIHFATHGLVASETESVSGSIWGTRPSEAALLLTPPRDVVESLFRDDDGLLTASEIAQLKLNADLVVLSACNTAAAREKSNAGELSVMALLSGRAKEGEALSGLAAAFFQAGARALLVSHWAVDSLATVKFVTTAFAELKSNPSIGRSEAMRRAMLAAMDDKSPRRSVPAAHPAVWAPFALVGDGASTR